MASNAVPSRRPTLGIGRDRECPEVRRAFAARQTSCKERSGWLRYNECGAFRQICA